MAVPYTFGSATTSIPLSQLDSNFATTITLGNTAIQLGNTVTTLNNMTLGNVTVSSGNVVAGIASSTITQSMLATNVAGNGPAFAAYISGYQGGISQSTATKVTLNAEDFDTNSNFNTSTYNFTPTVAGYYQLTGVASFGSAGGTYPSGGLVTIYKNSSGISSTQYSGANQIFTLTTTSLVYMNGSTDTASLYVYMTGGTNGALNGGSYGTYLAGFLARSA
jgi:hypothetical protein